MKWVFLYACVAFACHGQPTSKPGDGVGYETKAACMKAGRDYAKKHKIRHGVWETECVQRNVSLTITTTSG